MKFTKNKLNGIDLFYTNPDPFEMGIIEVTTDGSKYFESYVGYVHAENPQDPNVIYIKLDHKTAGADTKDAKGGVKLQDFINFLQDLHDEEMKVRGLGR